MSSGIRTSRNKGIDIYPVGNLWMWGWWSEKVLEWSSTNRRFSSHRCLTRWRCKNEKCTTRRCLLNWKQTRSVWKRGSLDRWILYSKEFRETETNSWPIESKTAKLLSNAIATYY